MHHLDILQFEHPNRPFHQIRPTTGAIEKEEPGVGHDEAEWYPGQTDPGSDVEDLLRTDGKPAGEEQ
jgi:hypothetical protein